ncbi:hypothetical protein [Novosphingobium sp.]|uniref:hypothetical protein n=1 Tax=Novosphingobium sp. TaxID=1874826 RepID=UPI00260CE032|nr:hypothetical protein [Novosphingobium sp.]
MRPTPPAPIRQSFDLPGGHRIDFEFRRPDLLSYEITPYPRFKTRAETMEFIGAYKVVQREFLVRIATATGLVLAVVDALPDGSEAIGPTIAPAGREC